MLVRGVRGVSVALLAARGRAVGVLAAVVGLCGLCAVALPGSAAALPLGCAQSGSAVTCTFSETGMPQSWTVPSGVGSASFVVDGASGGASSDGSEAGGLGGQVSATLGSLGAGQMFTIEVGGTAPKGGQGFNGGGSGGAGGAGGGGGFSSVNLGSTVELVAGGGGGGAQDVTDNACTGPVTTKGGAGGAGGQFGVDGNTGDAFTCSNETLAGGGGGHAGGPPSLVAGVGGDAGQPSGTANNSCGSGQGFAAGSQGTSTSSSTGGNGATGNGVVTVEGSGGGGGGGYPLGGGGGGSSAHESPCALRGGGGGGGGGSSYAASTASGVLFATGVSVQGASGNGQVTITYTPPVSTPPKATPVITTTPSASPVEVGHSISDSATVTGGDSPSGTVTFDLFANDSCSGTAAFTSSNRPLAGGNALSTSFTTTMAGTFHWVAIYNGDANNNAVSTSCSGETVTVLPQNTPPITTPPITAATITAATISSKHHRATFTFDASGASGFECALVKQPTGKHEKQPQPRYGACTSPTAYKHLKPGRYTFYVRTISVGAVNGPPATKHFRIR